MNDIMNGIAAFATTKSFQAKKAVREQLEGQGLVEYVLIIALLSIACIVVMTLCGDQIRAAFKSVTNTLSAATNNGAVTTTPGVTA